MTDKPYDVPLKDQDGGYNRVIEASIDKRVCKGCGLERNCLVTDSSNGEYSSVTLCRNCIRNAFREHKRIASQKKVVPHG